MRLADELTTRTRPVFHDDRRTRWKVAKSIGYVAGIAASTLIGILVLSTLINPVLPRLGLKPFKLLPGAEHLRIGPVTATNRFARNVSVSDFERAESHLDRYSAEGPALSPAGSYRSKLVGFYVNWDQASLDSLKRHLGSFDVLVPEWLHVAGPSSAITQDDAVTAAQTLSYVRWKRPGLAVMPLVNNYDQTRQTWDGTNLAKSLRSATARARIIAGLLSYVRGGRFAGITIDWENLPPSTRPYLTSFMAELYARFHPAGLRVSETVPADDPGFDYTGLAQHVDSLVVMAYDEHAPGSSPGPVASQSWFDSVLAKRLRQVPASKLVVGIGSYGYDWGGKAPAQPVTFEQAMAIAKAAGSKPTLDPTSLTMHFDYRLKNVVHHVWVLDAVSAFDEIVSAERRKPAGYALWRLGSEDPTVWRVFDKRDHLGAAEAASLRTLDLSNGVASEGQGEILRVTGLPVVGERTVSFDASAGAIVGETVVRPAQPYTLSVWGGAASKDVALTFDDGPDPQWTPQILDVLDTDNAPGTFFVIGENANAQPAILKRELALGEEIGNHTFTHPNIAVISPTDLKMELDATQRLLEAKLGIRTLLFRPPYGEDAQPDTPREVQPLLETSSMGYYTVGMGVDPGDWARPGVQQIVERTMQQVEDGRGHIVLLHDGGGDRSETVQALPTIIRDLRAKGYRLVTVSQLVGLPRSTVMPNVPAADRFFATIDDAAFDGIDWTQAAIYWLFIGGIVLGIGRMALIGSLAVAERVRDHSKRRTNFPTGYRPLASVIVPAYNEAKVIVRSVEALLASDYDNLEIIIVDDGSDDDTFAIASAAFADDGRVTVLTKDNGGKSRALNHGIERSSGEVLIGLDADTLFATDAIGKLVRHFSDPRVGAVAGNAKVGNRINLLTRWQALEYITNQNLDRRAFDLLNCITVVPGAIGAWRRDLVLEVGGFLHDTLAEDADLTLRVLEHGAIIAYEDEAYAFTEAPDTVRGLVQQRCRWVFGTMQTFWKHRRSLLSPKAGTLGMLAMPNVLVFQIFFPLISPIMDLVMLASIGQIIFSRYQSPSTWSPAAFEHILWYYALFLAVDFMTSALAFWLERDEQWSLIPWLVLQRYFYRQLMYFVVWKSVVNAVRGSVVGWHKLERKATVDRTRVGPEGPQGESL